MTMRAFKIVIVYNILAIASCSSIFNVTGVTGRQERADEIIDRLLQFGAMDSAYNITEMEDMLAFFYEGVKPEEFDKGAGYSFRNGTLSGITDPFAHRLWQSEWKEERVRQYCTSDGRYRWFDYLTEITAEIRHPRLLVIYNDVKNIGRAPEFNKLFIEFTGIRSKLRISRYPASNSNVSLEDIYVQFAENSLIRMLDIDTGNFTLHREFESHLRKELKSLLTKALTNVYKIMVRKAFI